MDLAKNEEPYNKLAGEVTLSLVLICDSDGAAAVQHRPLQIQFPTCCVTPGKSLASLNLFPHP